MEKINELMYKYKKTIIWNRIGIILFIIGLISLGITTVVSTLSKGPYLILSFLLTMPCIISAYRYTSITNNILDEMLELFNSRFRWRLNNDDIFFSTKSVIQENDIEKYELIIECNPKYIAEISNVSTEVINSLNQKLHPRFHLSVCVKYAI